MKKQLAYRVADSGDEPGILKIFEEVAPEVPTAVRSGTEELIKRYVKSRKSWVAVGDGGEIIGYALAEPRDSKTLSLAYLGVSKAARNQRVSSALISKLQEIGAPIITDVRNNNKSSMVERFEHFGFIKCDADPFSEHRTQLLWEKPVTAGQIPPA